MQQKVDVAKARIESLNPLVTIQAVNHDVVQERESLDALVQGVDLVCVTDWHREGLVRCATCLWICLHRSDPLCPPRFA